MKLKQKALIFSMMVFFGYTASAHAMEDILSETPRIVSFSNVVSLQPDIITDAECTEVYSKLLMPAQNVHNYQTKFIDVNSIHIQDEFIDKDLTVRLVTVKLILHVPGKKSIATTHLASEQFNNKTRKADGVFFDNFCRGNVHAERQEQTK